MRDDIPPKAAAGAAAAIVRPIWLVSFRFTTPLRLCSRGNMAFEGNQYIHAGLEYGDNTLRLYNENGQFTAPFMGTRGHLLCEVWESYGEAPFVDADWFEKFSGEVGAREGGEYITCQLKPVTTRPEPHWYVTRPVFNHVPRRGTQVLTPTGIYTLDPY